MAASVHPTITHGLFGPQTDGQPAASGAPAVSPLSPLSTCLPFRPETPSLFTRKSSSFSLPRLHAVRRNAVCAMPGISLAAVVAVPHPRWDERPVVVAGTPGGNRRATSMMGSRQVKVCLLVPQEVCKFREVKTPAMRRMAWIQMLFCWSKLTQQHQIYITGLNSSDCIPLLLCGVFRLGGDYSPRNHIGAVGPWWAIGFADRFRPSSLHFTRIHFGQLWLFATLDSCGCLLLATQFPFGA